MSQQGPDLRLAVALALDGLRVETERDVVDEDAAVDLGEVDAALAAVDEGVEGADDVVAVDAEIEREVVAGAGRDAGVRQVASAATAATIACEPSPPAIASPSAPSATAPRTSSRGRSPSSSSIGSMPRLAGLVGEVEALGLAAAGLRVVEEDGTTGRGGVAEPGPAAVGDAGAGACRSDQSDDRQPLQAPVGEHHGDGGSDACDAEGEGGDPDRPAPHHRVPEGHGGEPEQRHDQEPLGQLLDDEDEREDGRDEAEPEGGKGSNSLATHKITVRGF